MYTETKGVRYFILKKSSKSTTQWRHIDHTHLAPSVISTFWPKCIVDTWGIQCVGQVGGGFI